MGLNRPWIYAWEALVAVLPFIESIPAAWTLKVAEA
jgi:hypothetical protein